MSNTTHPIHETRPPQTEAGCLDPTSIETGTPFLDSWLEARSLTPRSRGCLDHADRLLHRVAHDAVSSAPAARLLGAIRYRLANDDRSDPSIRLDGTAAENAAAVAMAGRLRSAGLLREAARRDGYLYTSINRRGKEPIRRLRRFLQGPWLEIGAYLVLREVLGEDAEIALNLVADGLDGTRLEADVLAVVGGRLLVVECKSGARMADGLPRFRDVADALGVTDEEAVVVAPKADPDVREEVQAFHRIRILLPWELATHVSGLVAAQKPVQGAASPGGSPRPAGSRRLTDAQLESAFVDALTDGPRRLNQLAAEVRDQLGCARRQVDPLVRKLFVAHRFLGPDGNPVERFAATVTTLAPA